jgi:hypothetical protein
MLWWLDPLDYYFTDVPYASTVIFELHYNQTCLAASKSEECFNVQVTHDGKPLKFDTCVIKNNERGSKATTCLYPDFKQHMEKISHPGDVFELCNQKFTPTAEEIASESAE